MSTGELALLLIRDPRSAYTYETAALERAAAYLRTSYPRGPETAVHRAMRAAENGIAGALRARRRVDAEIATTAARMVAAVPDIAPRGNGGTGVPRPVAPTRPPRPPAAAVDLPWAMKGSEL